MYYFGNDATTADTDLGQDVKPTVCAASTRPKATRDLQPWTAARCHRLLRQLQSRLAGLRKLSGEDRHVLCHEPNRSNAADTNAAPGKRVKFTYGRRKRHEDAGADDLEPSIVKCTPRRPVRTLGAMNMLKSSPVSGQVDIPSPVWRRIRESAETPRRAQANLDDLPESRLFAPFGGPLTEATTDLRPLRTAMGDERYRICHAVLGWLNTLLQSTTPEGREPPRNSLLGMCLRKIPACVANIESYEKELAKEEGRQSMWDTSNVSFELYGQLETLGAATCGWRPLKLAVRAHGLSLLCQAMAEGLFDPKYVALLVRLCVRLGCNEEASTLSISAREVLPKPRTMQSSLVEDMRLLPIRELLGSDGRLASRAAMASVSTLVQNGRLPTQWLSTRALSSLWATNLELMTTTRSSTAAFNFGKACLPPIILDNTGTVDSQPTVAEQRLANVVAGMVATSLALSTAISDEHRMQRRRSAQRRLLYLLDLCFHQLCRRKGRRAGRNTGLFVLALARHIVSTAGSVASSGFAEQARRDLLALAAQTKDTEGPRSQYRQAILLLCSVAQYRSRGYAISGRDSVADLCGHLYGMDLGSCFDDGCSLQKDVAFLLAQRTKDLRDLAFAESLRGSRDLASGKTMFSGWRWEEGISEWVLPSSETNNTPNECPRQALRQLPNCSRSGSQNASVAPAPKTIAMPQKRRRDSGRPASSGSSENVRPSSPQASLKGHVAPSTKRIRRRRLPPSLLQLLPSESDWDDIL